MDHSVVVGALAEVRDVGLEDSGGDLCKLGSVESDVGPVCLLERKELALEVAFECVEGLADGLERRLYVGRYSGSGLDGVSLEEVVVRGLVVEPS